MYRNSPARLKATSGTRRPCSRRLASWNPATIGTNERTSRKIPSASDWIVMTLWWWKTYRKYAWNATVTTVVG